jgi:predicted metal-dependent phosphoesterase TrpH
MPGFDPFLLCDFHIHTRWSDGTLTIREVCDLYGQTGHVDVIAITDHILMEKDWLARAGRVAALGRRRFSVGPDDFRAYRDEIAYEAQRALDRYGLLVLPGAEVTQNHLRAARNSHIIGLGLTDWISADQSAEAILSEIRRQGALSIACHPFHRTTRRLEISTCYLWDHRHELAHLIDAWEAGNRDDLFSVTSAAPYPCVANSDFHRPRHLYSWKTLLRAPRTWEGIQLALRQNVNVGVVMYRPDTRPVTSQTVAARASWQEPGAGLAAAG